jgi:hypothetical protein
LAIRRAETAEKSVLNTRRNILALQSAIKFTAEYMQTDKMSTHFMYLAGNWP